MQLKESSRNEPLQESIGILGISMGNSQFSESYIRSLFEEMRERYAGLAVMLPDLPAQSTLQALGYPADEITKNVRLSFNGIVNKCRRAIDALAIPNVKMVSWSDRTRPLEQGKNLIQSIQIEETLAYKNTYQQIQNLYENNEEFARDIRDTTRKVLTGKKRKDGRDTTKEDIEIGIKFLLQELAFIVNAANILEVGSTDYIYHELMPVLQNLYRNTYGYTPAINTGFSVYS